MEMIRKIGRMHLRDRLSLSEIAKRTGLSRNTIKKWWPGDSVRAQRPENLALRRSTKDWIPSLKSSLAKTCSLIEGMHATAACSPPSM